MEKIGGQKSTKIGVVDGKNMKKTVSVIVERQVQHPLYKKIVRVKKKFLAHDEYEKCKIGDMVKIVQSPFSLKNLLILPQQNCKLRLDTIREKLSVGLLQKIV
ncbi:uS17 family ribosomal protein [Acidobacteriota bacterium]